MTSPAQNWFGDSLLKAHVLYVSPTWVPNRGTNFDADKLVEALREADVDAIEFYCKDIFGNSYYDTRYELSESYPRDVVRELSQACRAAGTRFIAYSSVGWDTRAAQLHEEWKMLNGDGEPPFAEVQHLLQLPWLCLNTRYRDFALARLRELMSDYDPDGLFIDIFMDNIPGSCHCTACQTRFAEVNARPLPWPVEEPEDVVAVRAMQADTYEQFLSEVREIVSARPGALLTFNFVGGISGHTRRFSDLVDWHEVEAHAPDFFLQSRTSKILAAQGKPFEIMSPGCAKSVREGDSWLIAGMSDWMSMIPKPELTMKLEAAIALAHGGTLTVGVYPGPDGSIDEETLRPIQGVGRWIRECRTLFERACSVSDVCVLWNEESYQAASLELGERVELLSGDRSMQGVHSTLVSNHSQFDICPTWAVTLHKYKLVILPERLVTDEVLDERLREYVRQGGQLLVLHQASAIDRLGRLKSDFGLADTMGVELRGEWAEATPYVRLHHDAFTAELPRMPLLMRGRALEVQPVSASVLATFVPELAPRTSEVYMWPTIYNGPGPDTSVPAITVNRYGEGTCVYVAYPLASNVAQRALLDPTPRRLLANIIEFCLPDPVLRTNAPALVEIVANKWKSGETVLHFINYYANVDGHYALGDAAPGIGGIYVEFDAAAVSQNSRASLDGRSVSFEVTHEGRVRVEIPLLEDHLALVIGAED